VTLNALMDALRDSPAFQHKQDIAPMLRDLETPHSAVPVGDDCAVLADGDGYLLFAIEGFLNGFVARDPDFAGYCGVMVNVSDIYAMGGRPTAPIGRPPPANRTATTGTPAATPPASGCAATWSCCL